MTTPVSQVGRRATVIVSIRLVCNSGVATKAIMSLGSLGSRMRGQEAFDAFYDSRRAVGYMLLVNTCVVTIPCSKWESHR
jgi:hypothetical protein